MKPRVSNRRLRPFALYLFICGFVAAGCAGQSPETAVSPNRRSDSKSTGFAGAAAHVSNAPQSDPDVATAGISRDASAWTDIAGLSQFGVEDDTPESVG